MKKETAWPGLDKEQESVWADYAAKNSHITEDTFVLRKSCALGEPGDTITAASDGQRGLLISLYFGGLADVLG